MKKEDLSCQHKKGVSEILSYVLLVIIAIGASVLVFALIKALVPKPVPSCPNDVYLIIKDYKCSFSGKELNITILNKGRFSVDAAYVRIGNTNRETKTWINVDESNNFYFGSVGKGIAPNREATWRFNLSQGPSIDVIKSAGEYALEIQPAMWDQKLRKTAACEAVVSEVIVC